MAKQWRRCHKQKLIFRPIKGELEVSLVRAGTGVRDCYGDARTRLKMKQESEAISSATAGNAHVSQEVLKGVAGHGGGA